jgi:hypothetical protein
MKQTTRWMVTVSSDTDRLVRRSLAAAGRKGDLSRFVEDAVKSRLLEESLRWTGARRSANDGVRPANDGVGPAVEPDLIGERQQRG